MYYITNTHGQYLKLSLEGNVSFTNNEALGEPFNSKREATDFIRKSFPKKKRRYYKVKQNTLKEQSVEQSLSSIKNSSDVNFETCIKDINESINTYLTPDIEDYVAELQKYDRMILDVRHWIRDEKTKLNAYQGWKTIVVLQELERKRAACKKELQRIAILRAEVKGACKKAEDFKYDDYKNREIEDVAKYVLSA